MLIWLIPLAVLVVAILVLAFFIVKYYGKVASLDVSTDPKRSKRAQRAELYAKRIERIGGAPAKKVGRAAGKMARGSKGVVKKLYGRAQALERHYKRLQSEASKGAAGTREMRDHLLEEAKSYIDKGAYTGAEQRLIELLSLDPKNGEVYEVLGNVYVKTKQFEQARQTFEYAHSIRPEDASIVTSLGELALRDGDTVTAVDYFEAAVDLKPNNPKYLDFLIDSSILAGDRKRARKGLMLLKKSNPDNKKIEEFEARIDELPL